MIRDIAKNLARGMGEAQNLKIFQLCFWILILFPTLVFAMNNYKTYTSRTNPNYSFQYLDEFQEGFVDTAENCTQMSITTNNVVFCTAGATTNFFGKITYNNHFYYQGRIVDNQLDQLAEQFFLANQKYQQKDKQQRHRGVQIILIVTTLLVLGIAGYICCAYGVIAVFSGGWDLAITALFPFLGAVVGYFILFLMSVEGEKTSLSNAEALNFILIWLGSWFIYNVIQSFRINIKNPLAAILALISRITTPVFIFIIWRWISSVIDRFGAHGRRG